MDILDLGLLIFILFYIFKNAYLSIVLFALISLFLQQFSKNKLLFVLLPLLIAHLFFLYNNPQEGFKSISLGEIIRKRIQQAKQHANDAVNLQAKILSLEKKNKDEKKKTTAAEKETVVANNQTKIEETQKKAIQRVTAQINDIVSEHV